MDGEIDPETLQEAMDEESSEETDRRIVDIRSPAAFRRGHIPGSENVPFEELPDRVASLAGADHVVTVCPHGKASVQAARLIGSFEGTTDATVESLAGGLEAWDGPIETASGDDAADSSAAEEGPNPDAPF
ncbi:MAG: rhodanese-like domain-containing protein [Halobaculum sp.]